MTKRNILTAAVAALGALAVAFSLVVSSPVAEAAPDPDQTACVDCVMDIAMCMRQEVRAKWRDGQEVDLGAAMKAIGQWQGNCMQACHSERGLVCVVDRNLLSAVGKDVYDTCFAICET